MDKLFFRLFFVILVGIGSFYYAFPWYAYDIDAPFSGKAYKLGLDLQGGVELDYKVDLTEAKKEKDYGIARENSIIEGLKSIIDRRIESLKINDSVITTASYGGEKHIIVQIPLKGSSKFENDLNIKRAKEAIGRVVKIEFREQRLSVTEEDLRQRKELASSLLSEAMSSNYDFSVTQAKYKDNYENVYIGSLTGTLEYLSKNHFTLRKENISTGIYKEVLVGTGIETFSFANGDVEVSSEQGYWIINIKSFEGDTVDFDYAFVSSKPSKWKPATDSKGRVLNDKYFVKSSVQYDQAFQPVVELTFNDEGAKIFGEITKRLKGQPLAIFVGGELLTAPSVKDIILTGKAIITGNYSLKEAQKLSNDINMGVVPAPIYLTSERAIDSKLGLNSLDKLVVAGIFGFLLIFLFLVVTYRLAGFFSGVALFMYVSILLSIVKALGITLTLASIAGLILSIGIAIDSNILIFARIKEELESGKKIDEAVKNGFERSWSAIWDSNLTGFIISVILFVFGINMIKGFGLMLGIGIIVSLFSTMYISRLFVLILSKKGMSLNLFLGVKKQDLLLKKLKTNKKK